MQSVIAADSHSYSFSGNNLFGNDFHDTSLWYSTRDLQWNDELLVYVVEASDVMVDELLPLVSRPPLRQFRVRPQDHDENWTEVTSIKAEQKGSLKDTYGGQIRFSNYARPGVQAEFHLANLLIHFLHKPRKVASSAVNVTSVQI